MFHLAYGILILVCIAPIIPGLVGVVLSSTGYIPAVGLSEFSLAGFVHVWQWEGVKQSLALSVTSSLISTYVALLITFAIVQTFWLGRRWRWVENVLSALLALPHVAFAIGFAFLFAPTGMIARLLQSSLDYEVIAHDAAWLVNDPYAIGLTLALALKEVPFLLLMSIPILQQINISSLQKISASLGYSTSQFWWKVILPQWLRKMRFALFSVIAYGISVVDFSLVLGPSTPPTFSVLVWQWFRDPDLNLLPRAAAGTVILLVTACLMLALVVTTEYVITRLWRKWQVSGRHSILLPGKSIFSLVVAIVAAIIPVTIIWSFAQRWRFPDFYPTQWSTRFWETEWTTILPTIYQSLWIALLSGSLALVFALIAHEYKIKSQRHISIYIIALPMLIPQLSLLFGIQIATLLINANSYSMWVIWAHTFFAFPFAYLSLNGPWKSYNPNHTKIALSLGKTPWHIFYAVKLPMLLPAVLFAWAVAISVSLAQYLPTLMLGGGRIATITTEAVALSSGFDRRVTAIYAIWQAVLPFLFFTFAIVVSRIQMRRHRSIRQKVIINDLISPKPRYP